MAYERNKSGREKITQKRESWNELTNASGKTVLGEVPISYA
jgi:hypothetical protein